MFDFLFILFHPSCWVVFGNTYSQPLDTWLKAALSGDVIIEDLGGCDPPRCPPFRYRATINGQTFWTANGVGAFELEETNLRPSRKVAHRAMKLVDAKRRKLMKAHTKAVLESKGIIAK